MPCFFMKSYGSSAVVLEVYVVKTTFTQKHVNGPILIVGLILQLRFITITGTDGATRTIALCTRLIIAKLSFAVKWVI